MNNCLLYLGLIFMINIRFSWFKYGLIKFIFVFGLIVKLVFLFK